MDVGSVVGYLIWMLCVFSVSIELHTQDMCTFLYVNYALIQSLKIF